ncbi:Lysophospholipase L1 [Agromyces sp. CF514]|uniref:SGNH/GDSL hydrolase family protein n=1 Tax=Agromyces sp. CF514 TaxID=1881031 RepID=UPI0008F29097|nr:SGNH/GDSL hydrolase family protein [Agromyces sp. CF514]SFR72031.1 Lysophospholipase L1 [Agromyces sp. CF514]
MSGTRGWRAFGVAAACIGGGAVLGVLLAACGGAPASDRPEHALPADAPVVAFYGDSYTLGTGASSPERRWSSIIAAGRGWREFNPSVNGLGFVNNRSASLGGPAPDLVEAIVAHEPAPDLVFVTMGLNDNFSMPSRADEIRDAIDGDLARLSEGLPDARLVVVEPFWYTDERPESVEQIIGWVRSGAERVDAEWIGGASHWIEGHPEWMAADGLHPNDDGYAEMARRMDAELQAIGL